MSGNTSNGNGDTFEKQIYGMIMNDEKCDEFGFPTFRNPLVQGTIENAAQEYKKKYNLKKAYDDQEMLRKMRTDIRREYLTRKKQLKTLQRNAAVTFRVAEMTLQEHYSKEFASTQCGRVIDINAPLVSEVILPHGKIDLKQFNREEAFEELRKSHIEMYDRERQNTIEFMRESDAYHERRQREEEEQRRPYEPREIPWDEWIAGGHVSEKCLGCNDLECSDCYSYGNDSDGDSYDSSYCAEFGYYPREYNWERECREAEEAREAQAQAQQEEENRNRQQFCEEYSDSDSDDDQEQEEPMCDDITIIEPKERHVSSHTTVASTSTTSKDICARKKAASKSSAAAAAKARIAKQQQKKGKKFVPVQIALNDNRSRHEQDEEATATLSRSKLEINLPKKNLQGASREAVKRYNKKLNRINAAAKQTNAHGCGIANLPDPNNPRYGNESE
jgi:hypothetical protein